MPSHGPSPWLRQFRAEALRRRQRRSTSIGSQSGNFTWSNNGEKLEVNYRGAIEFTDDDSDVKSLTPGGWLRIRWNCRQASGPHSRVPGRLHRARSSAGSGPAVGAALRARRPQVARDGRCRASSGRPASARRRGSSVSTRPRESQGVLAEIALVEGSWAKRMYFSELLKMPGLDRRTMQQALAQAGREVESDFELASLLISARSGC